MGPSSVVPHLEQYVFEDEPHTMRVRLSLGMTGMGKSSLMRYQLQQIEKLSGRYILVDPTADDHSFRQFGIVVTVRDVAKVLGPRTARKFHLRVQTKSIAEFEYLCWEAKRQGDCFFVVDEIWNFCDTKGGTKMKPEAFNELATEGRHQRVRIVGTCQRPTQIHNNLLKLAQEVAIFRTEDLGGGLKTKLRTKELQQLATELEPMQFLCSKNGKVTRCAVPL